MFDNHDPDDTEAQAYDDRNLAATTHDEPRGTYPPIEERPENTHLGFSDPDPAIDTSERAATWE